MYFTFQNFTPGHLGLKVLVVLWLKYKLNSSVGHFVIYLKKKTAPGMAIQACNPSIQQAEAGGSQVQGQPGVHSQFKASLGYTVRSVSKTKTKTNQPASQPTNQRTNQPTK
jgi:hypothetical protein